MSQMETVELVTWLKPFAASNTARHLETIEKVFGLRPTSKPMAQLLATNAASLSRVRKSKSPARLAIRIAVIAAVASAVQAFLRAQSGRRYDDAMPGFWLFSGRLKTRDGYKPPIEALSDTGVALLALQEVWAAMVDMDAIEGTSPVEIVSANGHNPDLASSDGSEHPTSIVDIGHGNGHVPHQRGSAEREPDMSDIQQAATPEVVAAVGESSLEGGWARSTPPLRRQTR